MIQLIDDQRDAWAVAEDVAGFIGTSQAMLWRELVIEDIEDGSKARARRVKMQNGVPTTVGSSGTITMMPSSTQGFPCPKLGMSSVLRITER